MKTKILFFRCSDCSTHPICDFLQYNLWKSHIPANRTHCRCNSDERFSTFRKGNIIFLSTLQKIDKLLRNSVFYKILLHT